MFLVLAGALWLSAGVGAHAASILPLEIVTRIYSEPAGTTLSTASGVATSTLVAAYVVLTLGLAVFVRWRYQQIEVTR